MKTNRKVLFVDDSPYRWEYFNDIFRNKETAHVEFAWAKNYDQAISQLDSRKWDVVFLDHDLEDHGDWEVVAGWRDGSAIIDWIQEHTPNIQFTVCHSMNPIGRKNMTLRLKNAGYASEQIAYYSFDSRVEQLTDLIAHGNFQHNFDTEE